MVVYESCWGVIDCSGGSLSKRMHFVDEQQDGPQGFRTIEPRKSSAICQVRARAQELITDNDKVVHSKHLTIAIHLMPAATKIYRFTCAHCLPSQQSFIAHDFRARTTLLRFFTSSDTPPRERQQAQTDNETASANAPERASSDQEGAMSRRLAEMTDESYLQGGRDARKVISEAGFSEELKRELEAKILERTFRSDNPTAFAQLAMPSSAGRGTKEQASVTPWSGSESVEDAALRMLNDAHKPLRGIRAPKPPTLRGSGSSLDLRMKNAVKKSRGERLATARDRTSAYALSQDPSLSEKEKEDMRKELKERFTAGARPMPATIQGLASLANERIEDAISRGQFKDIQRGKGKNIERDYNASSPFLDTTEYFMNKIIQKQEIVPPWIEKQQELVKEAQTFRSRLRTDWKRHAARVISSKGGSMEQQIRRAEAYALAEASVNPKWTNVESLSEIDVEGRISQVTIKESTTPHPAADTTITVSDVSTPESSAMASSNPINHSDNNIVHAGNLSPGSDQSATRNEDVTVGTPSGSSATASSTSSATPLPTLPPFRDPAWESLENAYHSLAISSLNSLARSYNLMAPDLAKKPYFSLSRELRSCFADVAPHLPAEIRERARKPEKIRVEVVGHKPGGVLERFGGDTAKVYDSVKPNYGFRQFWRDLWGKEEESMG
ncbi:MAG: hypothetical protein Q9214_002861 [Letrouitia sp. 1 TL-2023]